MEIFGPNNAGIQIWFSAIRKKGSFKSRWFWYMRRIALIGDPHAIDGKEQRTPAPHALGAGGGLKYYLDFHLR
jgi:hypothetical protein